jgi:hypothetical protein
MNQPATKLATMSNPRTTKLIIELSPPLLSGQALARRLLLPIRPHVNALAAALAQACGTIAKSAGYGRSAVNISSRANGALGKHRWHVPPLSHQ